MDLVGWKCPKCERILSPFVPSCPYCLPKEAEVTNTVDGEGITHKEEPKVQLNNEIFAEWMNGPTEGGGK